MRARYDSYGSYDIASAQETVKPRRYYYNIIGGSYSSVIIGGTTNKQKCFCKTTRKEKKIEKKKIEIREVDAVSIYSVCVSEWVTIPKYTHVVIVVRPEATATARIAKGVS